MPRRTRHDTIPHSKITLHLRASQVVKERFVPAPKAETPISAQPKRQQPFSRSEGIPTEPETCHWQNPGQRPAQEHLTATPAIINPTARQVCCQPRPANGLPALGRRWPAPQSSMRGPPRNLPAPHFSWRGQEPARATGSTPSSTPISPKVSRTTSRRTSDRPNSSYGPAPRFGKEISSGSRHHRNPAWRLPGPWQRRHSAT